jgi:hypothetical protein
MRNRDQYRSFLSELPYDKENSTRNFSYCATSLLSSSPVRVVTPRCGALVQCQRQSLYL